MEKCLEWLTLAASASMIGVGNITTAERRIEDGDMDKERAAKIPQEWTQFGEVFAALGEPERQRLVLAFDADEELNAGELAAVSNLTRPAVSFHLKILSQAGVLLREKRGREVFFKLNLSLLEETFGRCAQYVSNRRDGLPRSTPLVSPSAAGA